MSQIYNLEPPTAGKLVLRTSFGDIDVELWPKEAPLACRNFVQLALEGYYDDTIFHRVIPKFMVQGGDPTGTGTGGESIYGKPFKDEFHSRLKFNHRGLLAMANPNVADANSSQFFLTLDSTEWLQGKHTIFGKVTGQTVFNLLRMGTVETDKDDRPVDPPRLKTVEVLNNPFDDLTPRHDAPHMLAKKKQPTKEELAEAEAKKKKKSRKKVNDRTLLSFGDDEGLDDLAGNSSTQGGMRSMHDVVDEGSSRLSSVVAREVEESLEGPDQQQAASAKLDRAQEAVREDRAESLRHRVNQATTMRTSSGTVEDEDFAELQERMRRQQKQRMEKLGRGLSARTSGSSSGGKAGRGGAAERENEEEKEDPEDEKHRSKQAEVEAKRREYEKLRGELKVSKAAVQVQNTSKEAPDELLTPFQQQRMKHLKRNRDKNLSSRQDATLARLAAFSSKLSSKKKPSQLGTDGKAGEAPTSKQGDGEPGANVGYSGEITEKGMLGGDSEDEGEDWFTGKLKFKRHIDDSFRVGGDGRDVDDYVTIDSRNEPVGGPPPEKRARGERVGVGSGRDGGYHREQSGYRGQDSRRERGHAGGASSGRRAYDGHSSDRRRDRDWDSGRASGKRDRYDDDRDRRRRY